MSNQPSSIDHDQLFKQLIQEFFEEFILLFFPDAYEEIDFHHVSFLNQEYFTDLVFGERNYLDVVAETKVKGEDGFIIVHIEPQSTHRKDFNQRMFRYFCHLYLKHGKPILPIAVFTYDQPREESDTFEMQFSFFDVLHFHYLPIVLKKRNWRDFLRQDNPVAAALMAKMGYNEDEKVQMKKEFMRMIITFELNEAKMQLLMSFFESYLKLNQDEERQFQGEIQKLVPEEATKIMEMTTSWHKKGRQEGRIREAIDLICKFLQKRFGSESSELQNKVKQIDDLETLNELSDKIFAVQSLDDATRIIDHVLP